MMKINISEDVRAWKAEYHNLSFGQTEKSWYPNTIISGDYIDQYCYTLRSKWGIFKSISHQITFLQIGPLPVSPFWFILMLPPKDIPVGRNRLVHQHTVQATEPKQTEKTEHATRS